MPLLPRPLPRALPLILALAALALACARSAAPSPAYAEAQARWLQLVQRLGEAAADDPGADAVLALLAQVPASSADAPAATELRGRIEAARAATAEDQARRARLLDAVGNPSTWAAPSSTAGDQGDAQAPAQRIALGMKQDDFVAAHGACFDDLGAVSLAEPGKGPGSPGRMYGLRQDQACQAQHAALLEKRLVFVDGALASVSAASTLKAEQKRQQVQLGTLPDGGVGMVVDGGVVPLPEGAVVEQAPAPAEGAKP